MVGDAAEGQATPGELHDVKPAGQAGRGGIVGFLSLILYYANKKLKKQVKGWEWLLKGASTGSPEMLIWLGLLVEFGIDTTRAQA
jgi:hypothetical protein